LYSGGQFVREESSPDGLGDDAKSLPIIVYEASGRDGKRTVAFANGQINEVDAERAAELGLNRI
jgi:hypothetical protein